MKENMLEYKGYHTIVRYNAETGVLRGVIEGINDFVDFQTYDLNEVKNEFYRAVDDYLVFCEEVGKEPEKEQSPVTGDWNMASLLILFLLSSAFVIVMSLRKKDIIGGRNERQ